MNMRKSMVRNLVAVVFTTCAVTSVAADWYVDRSRPDDTGDGCSVATAKRTIQAAVDAAAANDTVHVLPGVYDEGLTNDPTDTGRSRVFIDKPLTLVSTEGRMKTVILGQYATSASSYYHSSGLGGDAIRCIYISTNAVGDTKFTRIEGFTIANGATMNDPKSGTSSGGQIRRNLGGGVAVIANDDASGSDHAYVIDCAITNCVATRAGGGLSGTYVRTAFLRNKALSNGSATRAGTHFNCVFMGHDSVSVIAYPWTTVNCTFRKNAAPYGVAQGSDDTVYNCLFDQNASDINSNQPYNSASTRGSWGSWAAGRGNVFSIAIPTYASPAPEQFGDWALMVSPECIGCGKVDWLNKIPSEFRGTDFNGRPRQTGGKVSIGAAEPYEPACAPFRVDTAGVCVVTPDGARYACAAGDRFYSSTWPVQYKVWAGPDSGKEIVRIKSVINGNADGDAIGHRRALDAEGYAYFTPPQDLSKTNSVVVQQAVFRYVDVNVGSDVTGDGTKEKPYKTITHAAGTTSYGTVLVRPGVYTPENQGTTVRLGCRNTVALTNGWIYVKATGKPEETIIEGVSDPDAPASAYGCGPKAVRAIAASINCMVQGFTIRNGHTDTNDTTLCRGGAAMASDKSVLILVDCVISNCVGLQVGSCQRVTMDRCRVSDVRSLGGNVGTIAYSTVANSVLVNSRGDMMVGYDCKLYNATVMNYWNVPFSPHDKLFAYNSLLVATNFALTAKSEALGSSAGSLFWGFTYDAAGIRWADPYFRSPLTGDFSVGSGSEAQTNGSYTVGDWYAYARTDVDNRPYAESWKTSKRYAGAVQKSYNLVVATSSGSSGAGISPSGRIAADPGQTIVFTATEKDVRNFSHFLVNGVRTESADGTYAYAVPAGEPQPLAIQAVYLTDWYVDDDGSDANTGADAAHPLKTLTNALARVISGDTVHVAEGVYREGAALQQKPVKQGCVPSVRARAVVPSYVTVVGAGPEKTFVCGQDAQTSPDQYGCGADAMRGVFLEDYAVLSNLTVCAGRTDCVDVENDNNHGGGVLARSEKALVIDCVISNNASVRAGGARYGTYVHCRFIENTAVNNGAAGRDVYLSECYFARNRGSTVFSFPKLVCGCTFAADNVSLGGGVASALGGVSGAICNTLFAMRGDVSLPSGGSPVAYSNCVFRYESRNDYHMSVASANCMTGTLERLVFTSDGVPVPGQNVAVDAGDVALRRESAAGDVDIAGLPRVSNGTMDIGAFEADWKPLYAKHLYRRNVTVESAPADAVLAEKKLLLPGGEIVSKWQTQSVGEGFWIPVEVTGNGVLSVVLNGEAVRVVTQADGCVTLNLSLAAGENELVFSYAGTDADAGKGAVICRGVSDSGLLILIK